MDSPTAQRPVLLMSILEGPSGKEELGAFTVAEFARIRGGRPKARILANSATSNFQSYFFSCWQLRECTRESSPAGTWTHCGGRATSPQTGKPAPFLGRKNCGECSFEIGLGLAARHGWVLEDAKPGIAATDAAKPFRPNAGLASPQLLVIKDLVLSAFAHFPLRGGRAYRRWDAVNPFHCIEGGGGH